jgi:hypothetical protein
VIKREVFSIGGTCFLASGITAFNIAPLPPSSSLPFPTSHQKIERTNKEEKGGLDREEQPQYRKFSHNINSYSSRRSL